MASATVRDYGSCLSFTVMLTAGVAALLAPLLSRRAGAESRGRADGY